MKLNFLIVISLNVLKINIDFFLFKISFKKLTSKLFSFNLFLTISFKDHISIKN